MENRNVYVWLKIYKKNDENSNKGYILKVDVKYHKTYMVYIEIYHFYQTE